MWRGPEGRAAATGFTAYGRYAAFCLVLVVAVAALALRVVWERRHPA